MISEKLNKIISEDNCLNLYNKEKEKIISKLNPKIIFNLETGELEYNIKDDVLDKIDELIEERIKYLIKIYERKYKF